MNSRRVSVWSLGVVAVGSILVAAMCGTEAVDLTPGGNAAGDAGEDFHSWWDGAGGSGGTGQDASGFWDGWRGDGAFDGASDAVGGDVRESGWHRDGQPGVCHPDPQGTPDSVRTVLVAHPFGASFAECGKYVEVLRLDDKGELSRPGSMVEVGGCPSRVSFSPDGRLALVIAPNGYLSTSRSPSVVVLTNDGAGNVELTGDLDQFHPVNPADIAFSPDGTLAYVSDLGGDGDVGGVHVFVVQPGCSVHYTNTIPLSNAGPLKVLPDGNHALVIGGSEPTDTVALDLRAMSVLKAYDLFGDVVQAPSIALRPGGEGLLIPNTSASSKLGNTLSALKVDGTSGTPVPSTNGTVTGVTEPTGAVYSPDGKEALVTNPSSDSVTWFNVGANGTISIGGTLTGIPRADRVTMVTRGKSAGLVLVTSVTSVHAVMFTSQGIADRGKVSLGTGSGAVAGDIAVEP